MRIVAVSLFLMHRLNTAMFVVVLYCSFSLFLKNPFFPDYLYKEVFFLFFQAVYYQGIHYIDVFIYIMFTGS